MPGAVFTVVAASTREAMFVDEARAESVRPLSSASGPAFGLEPDPPAFQPSWREAQAAWAARAIADRLQVLRSARHLIAEQADAFAAAIPPELARNPADTMAAEILPLLEACRFLERNAARILAPRRLGRRGLPFWLAGVKAEVQRAAFGKVLVIAPANYPLLLPGVQTLQALAAGNAVVWKPGLGGARVAGLLAQALYTAGLPPELLKVTGDSVDATSAELDANANGLPDKVFFTGSAKTGRLLLRRLAETATPSVMELSGCDAVIALASADWDRLTAALAFGMRLNGSATCMAPRRLFLPGAMAERRQQAIDGLLAAFEGVRAVAISGRVQLQLRELLDQAAAMGAEVHGELANQKPDLQKPILVSNVTAAMRIAHADIFAPLLLVMAAEDEQETLRTLDHSFYALTAAVFGEEREARTLAGKITAGTVLVNDLIVPTADPRVPFGGRRRSGFGVTRGREGLLEMTAVKVVSVRRGRSVKHYEATTQKHEDLFRGVIAASHASTWQRRWQGVRQMIAAAQKLKVK